MEFIDRQTLTIEEAAKLLGISRGLAYQLSREGTLPTLQLGHRRLVPVVQFRRFLEGQDGKENHST